MASIDFFRSIKFSAALAGVALAAICTDASAHVSVGIGIGFPAAIYAPAQPVYVAPPPPPVYYAPPPPPPPAVVYQQMPVPAPVVYGEDWREHEWREHQAWRARQEYERRRGYYGYGY
jgi:hypothetical protein